MYLLRDELHAVGNINDFDDAMDLIHSIWTKVHPECVFSEEEPNGNTPETVALPHISYEVLHRKHSEHFSDGKKPRQLRVYPDPDQPGQNITEASEWFDCISEFLIYGNNKREAKKWMKLFEEFILTYTGYFKEQGIAEILFLEEQSPVVSSEYRQDLPHRRLRYLVKIQRTQTLRSIRLDYVDVVAQTPADGTVNDNSIIYSTSENNEFLTLYDERIK